MASQTVTGAAASRYAISFVDIASDSGKLKDIEQDLADMEAMMRSSEDLSRALKSPVISREDKKAVVQEIAKKAKFQEITSNFLSLLAQNDRLPMLGVMINAVRMELSRRRGEITANVMTAFQLPADQQKALQDALTKAMGQAVAVNMQVKQDLIGGMVVTVGSQMIDASVKRKLERLKIAMKGGANSNREEDKAA